jgi:hypothetical protein
MTLGIERLIKCHIYLLWIWSVLFTRCLSNNGTWTVIPLFHQVMPGGEAIAALI